MLSHGNFFFFKEKKQLVCYSLKINISFLLTIWSKVFSRLLHWSVYNLSTFGQKAWISLSISQSEHMLTHFRATSTNSLLLQIIVATVLFSTKSLRSSLCSEISWWFYLILCSCRMDLTSSRRRHSINFLGFYVIVCPDVWKCLSLSEIKRRLSQSILVSSEHWSPFQETPLSQA